MEKIISEIKQVIKNLPSSESQNFALIVGIIGFFYQTNGLTFGSKEINDTFEAIGLPFSKTSAAPFLSKRSKGKDALFFKLKTGGYKLSMKNFEKIQSICGIKTKKEITKYFIDPLIYISCRGYVKKTADEINSCYDDELYIAASVLCRKLVEILLVDCFEKKNLMKEIVGPDKRIITLSQLIIKFNEHIPDDFIIHTEVIKMLKDVKWLGDMSIHNKNFVAMKSDLDLLNSSFVSIVRELIGVQS